MSVLIRGMNEIPEDGAVLVLVVRHDNGKAYIEPVCTYGYSMELVKIPEHHGRLIDADRLMRVYEDRLEKVADRYGVDSSEAGILSGAMKLLMIELGIVEAEEGD